MIKVLDIGAGDFKLIKNNNLYPKNTEVIIYEPNIIFYNDLVRNFSNYHNIKIHNKAVTKLQNKYVKFYNYGYASFVDHSESFVNGTLDLNSNNIKWKHWLNHLSTNVENIYAGEIDFNVDFLNLACNGCELEILNNMTGTPYNIRTIFYTQTKIHYNYKYLVESKLGQLGYKAVNGKQNILGTYYEIIYQKL